MARESQPPTNCPSRYATFFAGAIVEAPPMLPILFAPVTCEEENISNLQVEGLPANFLSLFDPIFPYAKDASTYAEVTVAYE